MTDSRLNENVRALEERLREALRKAGRPATSVKMIAVTKYVDFETTCRLIDAGCKDLGESRPQHLKQKAEAAKESAYDSVYWHLIGHLQRNKVRQILPYVDCIHSIDSTRLLSTLSSHQDSPGFVAQTLLEVNISGDESKHGFAPQQMPEVVRGLAGSCVSVVGLMTMAARNGGRDQARCDFAALRKLRDRLQPECPENIDLKELSMGMSGDWEEAVAEGSTMIRIGSTLFEGVT